MKPFSIFFGSLVALAAWLALTPPVGAQDPIPLDQPSPQPLSTPAISEFDVELFGKLAHLWTMPDGTEVIQFYGEFALHMGPRRISSRDAVVWMKQEEYESRLYRRFEVFLWRDARVVEPGGSVTTGPVLFITLQSFGNVSANYDVHTGETSADSPLYLRADRVRRSLSPYRTPLYARETPLEVQRPADDREGVSRKDRQPIMIRPGKRMVTVAKGDERLIVAAGGVYIAQGAPRSADFLEIRAQDAVLFLRESSLLSRVQLGLEDQEPSDADLERALAEPMPEPGAEPQTDPQGLDVGSIAELLTAVYLEGDVILSRGERMIRANRLFYDLENNRALILDAVMRAPVPGRNLPIYVRAETVRQLSAREYEARNAIVSTSEFHTPHYAIGADKIILYDRTLGPPDSQITGLVAGTYKAYDTSIRIDGVPVSYWPYIRGDFKQGESVLQGISMGYRENFGAVIETQWNLSTLLGLETPEGFKSSLLLDYYSDRGPGAGINLDYKRDDYYGLLRTYYINDGGTDDFGGFRDDVDVPHPNRGRALWRHRQYLPRDWELTLEVSYISDSNFLESYFEREFDTDKEQETLLYLKKQHDNWAVTGLAKWKILSWIQTTESLPDIAFHWIGQPLGETASYFNESRFGNVRFRQDERLLFESRRLDNLSETDVTFRADTRHEIDLPFSLGPVKVVPYGVVRGGVWDGDEVGRRGGSIQRIFGQAGLRSSIYFWRVFPDVRSRLFDINGLRHLITPTVTAWVTGTNRNADELTPFTETVETIGSFSGVNVGVRQRLQTKRGAGDDQRVVDWMVLDIQTGFFDHDRIQTEFTRGWISSTRPEDSITSNFLRAEYLWRISDTTALLSDVIFDLNSGSVGSLDASFAVERTPRFSYFVGYRYIGEIESNLLGVGVNYRISRKHTLAIRDYFDLDRGVNGGFELAYIRKFPRWYVGVTFEFDNVKDQTSVSLSAWPEGLPSVAIGGRRYTGVADSVAIGD